MGDRIYSFSPPDLSHGFQMRIMPQYRTSVYRLVIRDMDAMYCQTLLKAFMNRCLFVLLCQNCLMYSDTILSKSSHSD
jgi:hypothetical protein